MTRDDIIRIAHEAKFEGFGNGDWVCTTEEIERFAQLVAAAERANWPSEMEAMERQVNILTDELAKAVEAEREACAKLCDELVIEVVGNSALAVDQCARTIRARG